MRVVRILLLSLTPSKLHTAGVLLRKASDIRVHDTESLVLDVFRHLLPSWNKVDILPIDVGAPRCQLVFRAGHSTANMPIDIGVRLNHGKSGIGRLGVTKMHAHVAHP